MQQTKNIILAGGSALSVTVYNRIARFIMTVLERGDLNVLELLDLGRYSLGPDFHGNEGWYILKVKTDLEMRGLIGYRRGGHGVHRRLFMRKSRTDHTSYFE